MSFGSVLFLGVFLPLAVAVHWALPRRAGWQNGWLVLASGLFAWSFGPGAFAAIAVSATVNYAAGLALGAVRAPEGASEEAVARASRRSRWLLGAALAVDLGALVAFKYLGFFGGIARDALGFAGLPLAIAIPSLALPLGISFWTLQQVGYLVDVHLGRAEPCRSPLTFALFASFFPQLQAGPIPRSGLIDQLSAPRRLDADALRTGAFRFFRGYVARFLVAAVLGELLVDPAFAQAGQVSAARHWVGLFAYAGQVFCDFAGYSEMAIGCALLLGVKLDENFDAPFLATDLLDLWKRWHMTLTRWLFDYVYSPLMTGESWLRGRLDLGFLVAFLASGLWHGAGWTFVLWGGLQGVGLAVHRRWDEAYRRMCRRDRAWVARRRSRPYLAASWLVTQLFFVLSLVPFRARSLGQAGAYARGLVHGGGTVLPMPPASGALNAAVCLALFVGYHLLRGRRLEAPPVVRGIAYGLLVVYLAMFMPLAQGTFIYAQF